MKTNFINRKLQSKKSSRLALTLLVIALCTTNIKETQAQTFPNYQLDLVGTSVNTTYIPSGWFANIGTPDRDDFDFRLRGSGNPAWVFHPANMPWSTQSTALLIGALSSTAPGYESIKTTITGLTPGVKYFWSIEATANTIVATGSDATSATLEVTFDGVSGGAYPIAIWTDPARYTFTFVADGDGESEVLLFAGNENIGGNPGDNPWFMALGGSGQFGEFNEVTIADVSTNEDDGSITVTATLTGNVTGGFTVDVSTSDGTATTADNDYTPINGQTLTFAGTNGETQTFTFIPTSDTNFEGDETVLVSLNNLQGTALSVVITDTATITLINDDVCPAGTEAPKFN